MSSNNPKPWKPRQQPFTEYYKGPDRMLILAPFIMGKKDECEALIGQCIMNWSNTEWLLVEIFAHVSQTQGWVSVELFQEIRKLRPRLAILYKSFVKSVGKKQADIIKSQIFKPLMNMSVERDKIAHGNWIRINTYPGCVIARSGWGKDEKRWIYDVPTLTALSLEIKKRWDPVLTLYWATIRASPLINKEGFLFPAGIDREKFDLQLTTEAPEGNP